MTSQLHKAPIEAVSDAHQAGDTNDSLIAEHARLNLRATLERRGHGANAALEEEQVINRVSWAFELSSDRKLNGTQLKSLDAVQA